MRRPSGAARTRRPRRHGSRSLPPEQPIDVEEMRVDLSTHASGPHLDAEPKPITLKGRAAGVLYDVDYEGGVTLGPYDADFVELD
jgi:hypothetical protein